MSGVGTGRIPPGTAGRPRRGRGASGLAVGRRNRGLVIDAVRVRPGVSRKQVAEELGLTPAAVSNIIAGLQREGLVEESGQAPSSGGKRSTKLWVTRGARFAVGAHIDRGEIIVAAIDLGGNVLCSKQVEEAETSPVLFLGAVADKIKEVVEEVSAPERHLVGIGLATPGPLNPASDVIVNPPNLPGWENIPVQAILQSHIGSLAPITVERDANAAAIGEQWAGRARGFSDFMFVYLSTGLGAGIVLNNELYRGRSRGAGSLGHLVVADGGLPCRCGAQGCLETVCSQRGLLEEANRQPVSWRRRLGLHLDGQRTDEDYHLIAEAAEQGDERAVSLFSASAQALATAMVSMVNLLDLDAIILGGRGLWPQERLFHSEVRNAVRTRPINPATRSVEVNTSSLGPIGPAVGAAVLALTPAYSG